MGVIDRGPLQSFDWVLAGLTLALLGIGFGNLYSATLPGAEGLLPSEFKRQLIALGVSSLAVAVALVVDYRRLERWAPLLYLLGLLLLASTLALAPVTRGSRSWLVWGPFSVQPAEFAKLAMVVMLARWFHRHPPTQIERLRELFVPALIAAAPVGLIVLQRDLGVAVLTLLVAVTFLPFARIPARAWVTLAAAGVLGMAGLFRFVLREYQQQRILDFIDPSRDPLASGYQAMQSRIAVGSGGLFGQGWKDGPQTQLEFLPTQHSDFVFSVLAEEWGFVGGVAVLALYLVLMLWGLAVARNSKDGFGALLAVGIVGLLFWPAMINIAMVLGLAPVIGVPLPLLSYGGTSLLATLVALALLLNVSMRRYLF